MRKDRPAPANRITGKTGSRVGRRSGSKNTQGQRDRRAKYEAQVARAKEKRHAAS